MRINRTIESFYPYMSGPANQAFMISRLLEEKGISSPIYTTDYMARGSPGRESMDGVQIFRFRKGFGLMRYFSAAGFREAISKSGFDIMHSHNYRNRQADIACSAARKRNRPFVLHAHGSLLGYRSITKGLARVPYAAYDMLTRKKTALLADAVVVSSEQEVKEAVEFGIQKQRIYRIPMGVDVKAYSRIGRASDGPKKPDKHESRDCKEGDGLKLLFAGRLSRDRDLMPVLKALRRLREAGTRSVRLVVAGGEAKRSSATAPGYLGELKAYAEKHGLDVRFCGMLDRAGLIEEYKAADAFIYTSVWENFGQTILEASAAGLPIISTPVGVAPEIVKDGTSGFIVERGSGGKGGMVEGLCSSITALLDPALRKRMGERSRQAALEGFSWDDIMMRYEKLYLELLERA